MRRRDPTESVAWLLAIFFLPWAGLFLYLLVGENRLPLRRIAEHAEVLRQVDQISHVTAIGSHAVHPQLDPEQQSLVVLAENMGGKPILGGNRAEFLSETPAVIDRLIADIGAAQQHVHLLFYIYEDDDTGRRVADALAQAAARGVNCRLLADAVGSASLFGELSHRLTREGVAVRRALPVSWLRRGLARMDLRNHRKLAIIDGEVAYSGSQNIVNPTYGHRNLRWHDLMVRLTGPVVLALQSVFVEDWYHDSHEILDSPDIFPDPQHTGDVAIQPLPSGPTYPTVNYQRLVVAALHEAKRQVIITSPYLVPDSAMLAALQVAALRGVQIDLIVPERSDQLLTTLAGRGYYPDLMEMGVNLYHHRDGLLHAKTMTVDDTLALVGSGNFDIRSFYLNFELNLLFYGSDVTAKLRYLQRNYLEHAEQLTIDQWSQRPFIGRFLEDAARLFSPLL